MGVDIYGKNPQLVGEKPVINWENASEGARDVYFEAMDKWEEENPGYYFRANWWSWRPIHMLCNLAIELTELPFTTENWGYNDGGGLETQQECDQLADALDLFVTLDKKNLDEGCDRIYICLGAWATEDGGFVSQEEEDKLNKSHPIGTIMYNRVISDDGKLVQSAHSASLNHIKEFIIFLRNCGGFQIF